jgi:hypothetical protein
VTVDGGTWIERYAAALGVDAPSAEEVDALLALAGVAAHASERTAAPLSCWLAARARLEPAEALARAEALSTELTGNT